MMRPQVWLIEPSRVFRETLRQILSSDGMFVVAEMETINELPQLTDDDPRPDLLIIGDDADGAMGCLHQRLENLCAEWPETRVVLLSHEMDLPSLIAAMKAGIRGYLEKNIDAVSLKKSLALVLRGERVIPRDLVETLLGSALSQSIH